MLVRHVLVAFRVSVGRLLGPAMLEMAQVCAAAPITSSRGDMRDVSQSPMDNCFAAIQHALQHPHRPCLNCLVRGQRGAGLGS